LIASSREQIATSRALIDHSCRILESFSKAIDAHCYRSIIVPPRILLVDDNPDILEPLSNYLQLNGYAIEQARDGIEALEKLQKNRFDVILSDVKMPRMDGLTLASAVRANFSSTTIILMTADLPDRPNKVVARVGASHLLSKFRLDDLLAKLEESTHRAVD
jgi:CheY-like chemotaxis protein